MGSTQLTYTDPVNLQLTYTDPVNLLTNTDINILGNGGMNISVTRTYRSLSGDPDDPIGKYVDNIGNMGIGWNMQFGRFIYNSQYEPTQSQCSKSASKDSTTNHVLELSDGSRKILYNADFSGYDFATTDH